MSPLDAAWSMLKAIGDDWYEEDRPEWEEGDTANVYYEDGEFERTPITDAHLPMVNDPLHFDRETHLTDEELQHILLQNRMRNPSLSRRPYPALQGTADDYAGSEALMGHERAIREAFNQEYGRQ